MQTRSTLLLIVSFFITLSCSSSATDARVNSSLTQGNVQMTLVNGKTTKAEVLNNFGAPNITTRDGDAAEVWVYERNSTKIEKKSGYATLMFVGSSTSGFERSSQNMTVILRFNSNDVLIDFDSRSSSF